MKAGPKVVEIIRKKSSHEIIEMPVHSCRYLESVWHGRTEEGKIGACCTKV